MTANPFAALLDGVSRYYVNGQDDSEGYLLDETEVLAALAAAVPADLAEAGKVLEGVTPGPWETDERLHDAPYQTIRIGPSGNYRVCKVWQDDCADDYNPEQRANARFIAWTREGVPALLARIAAQEAQNKGLEARMRESALQELASLGQAQEAYEAQLAAETALAAMTEERDEWQKAAMSQHEDFKLLKTALAAERAKVAKLVEALTLIESMTVHSGGEIHGVTLEHYRTAVEVMRQEASIALDEIGYGVSRAAITEAGQ